MRFGLFFLLEKPAAGNDVEVYANTMEQIRLADELGYDYIWLAEHRFTRYGIAPDVLVLAAAAASVTRRVRIGTAVVVLPFHNPVLLAEQVAMVDVLSGGALRLRGWAWVPGRRVPRARHPHGRESLAI